MVWPARRLLRTDLAEICARALNGILSADQWRAFIGPMLKRTKLTNSILRVKARVFVPWSNGRCTHSLTNIKTQMTSPDKSSGKPGAKPHAR